MGGLDARVEQMAEDGGEEKAELRGVMFGDEGWGEGESEADGVEGARGGGGGARCGGRC